MKTDNKIILTAICLACVTDSRLTLRLEVSTCGCIKIQIWSFLMIIIPGICYIRSHGMD